MRQIARRLLGTAQTVAAKVGVVDQKAEVVRLQRNAARGLTVEQSHELDGGGAPGAEIAHQEISGDPRMHQALDEQHMLAGNGEFVAEKNLEHARLRLVELLVARL